MLLKLKQWAIGCQILWDSCMHFETSTLFSLTIIICISVINHHLIPLTYQLTFLGLYIEFSETGNTTSLVLNDEMLVISGAEPPVGSRC